MNGRMTQVEVNEQLMTNVKEEDFKETTEARDGPFNNGSLCFVAISITLTAQPFSISFAAILFIHTVLHTLGKNSSVFRRT